MVEGKRVMDDEDPILEFHDARGCCGPGVITRTAESIRYAMTFPPVSKALPAWELTIKRDYLVVLSEVSGEVRRLLLGRELLRYMLDQADEHLGPSKNSLMIDTEPGCCGIPVDKQTDEDRRERLRHARRSDD